MVPEQLSSMPLLEMTEEQDDLLRHLPDAQHQPAARQEAILALSAVPAKHNTAINQLFAAGQSLHDKVRFAGSADVASDSVLCYVIVSSAS